MNDKNQKKLDRAMKALMSMGSVPEDIDPKFTQEDLDRKFRMRWIEGDAPRWWKCPQQKVAERRNEQKTVTRWT